MLALSRLTGKQPLPVRLPKGRSADLILAGIAREVDRASRSGPLIDGIDSGLIEVALSNDLKDPKTRETARKQLVRLAEADILAGKCVRPFLERMMREQGIQIL